MYKSSAVSSPVESRGVVRGLDRVADSGGPRQNSVANAAPKELDQSGQPRGREGERIERTKQQVIPDAVGIGRQDGEYAGQYSISNREVSRLGQARHSARH